MIKKVFNDHILCKPYEDTSISSRGVYRGLQKEKPIILKAIHIGENVKSVKPNDIILVEKFTGSEVEIGAEEYIIVRENNIVAILDLKD